MLQMSQTGTTGWVQLQPSEFIEIKNRAQSTCDFPVEGTPRLTHLPKKGTKPHFPAPIPADTAHPGTPEDPASDSEETGSRSNPPAPDGGGVAGVPATIRNGKGDFMTEYATLQWKGRTYELPVIEGTEGELALDISRLRAQSGLVTIDTGFANTGSCKSAITFMDGEKGILRYRGYPIEQLAEHSTFREVAYLLINGELPTQEEVTRFSVLLNDHSLVHEDMRHLLREFPQAIPSHGDSFFDGQRPQKLLSIPRGRRGRDQRHRDTAHLQGADAGGHVLQNLPGSPGGLSSAGPFVL
jgi:hypothetical protein